MGTTAMLPGAGISMYQVDLCGACSQCASVTYRRVGGRVKFVCREAQQERRLADRGVAHQQHLENTSNMLLSAWRPSAMQHNAHAHSVRAVS